MGGDDCAGRRLQDLIEVAKALEVFPHLFDNLPVAPGMSDEYAVADRCFQVIFHIPHIVHDKTGILSAIFLFGMIPILYLLMRAGERSQVLSANILTITTSSQNMELMLTGINGIDYISLSLYN